MNSNDFNDLIKDMWCCEAYMPNKNDIISDEIIKNRIDNLQILNEKDDRDGRTLLMFATIYQRPLIIEYLLEKGLNVNEQDNNGFTALHFAVQTNKIEIIRILLKYGADVNVKNKFGNIPIMLSNNATSIEIFKLLIANGTDIYCPNNFGVTAANVFTEKIGQSECTGDGSVS